MWYMLLEPKLRIYSSLLPRPHVPGYAAVRRAPASRWAIDSLVARGWKKLGEAQHRRRRIEEFARLDDRLLRDIGIDRARVPGVVDAMFRREPNPQSRETRDDHGPKKAGSGLFVRTWKYLARAWVRRRAINELARLDNWLLRDIGLERDRIPDAVDAMLDRKPAPPPSASVHYLAVDQSDSDARDDFPARAAA